MAVHRGISGFEARSRLSSWLHKIVVNVALTHLRKSMRRIEVRHEDTGSLDDLREEEGLNASPDLDIDRLLERALTRQRVRSSIEGLPEGHRTILVLRDIAGHDTAETAKRLGISVGAAKVRLHRARLALRKSLEQSSGVDRSPE